MPDAASSPPAVDIRGFIVDPLGQRSTYATMRVAGGRIFAITPLAQTPPEDAPFILPGLIDAHVHIESSMLVPTEFARVAVIHGTVGTVSDPHEIANVLGISGVDYMIDNGRQSPFKFHFGAPSCVPATCFETAGAAIDAAQIAALMARDDIFYLSEVMNFPGVIQGDPQLRAKIAAARAVNKPIDGHAPALRGAASRTYFAAGITTDHECCALDEALEKITCGAAIIIREGSAARNFDALWPLIDRHPDRVMLGADDKHPDELEHGHINLLLREAVARGVNPYNAIRAATINPINHYHLNAGQLRVGDPADFILVDNLANFAVRETWIDGVRVAKNGVSLLPRVPVPIINRFAATPKSVRDIALESQSTTARVIQMRDGQLITQAATHCVPAAHAAVHSDPAADVLKMVVVNRYAEAPPAVALIRGFGVQHGAIASSVAHDSHNIVAVGVADEDIIRAINLVIEQRGGLSLAAGDTHAVLPLPVAGLMSDQPGPVVAATYAELNRLAHALGTPLRAPFMSLSFMALLVIPALKLSDRGLFDGARFELLPLWENAPPMA